MNKKTDTIIDQSFKDFVNAVRGPTADIDPPVVFFKDNKLVIKTTAVENDFSLENNAYSNADVIEEIANALKKAGILKEDLEKSALKKYIGENNDAVHIDFEVKIPDFLKEETIEKLRQRH